jgi:CPA2 family monovalent cation:H+ antiporter-2
MTHGPGPSEYKDIFVFLAAAGVLVPLFSRLKISPVLGFLAAGVLLGPDGLGRLAGTFEWIDILTISDRTQIEVLAELGVVFLMFTIGLELSWERLKSMRRLVFGMGMAQILVCAVLLAGLFYVMGRGVGGSMVLGLALALSSTAVVMPVMAERGRLSSTAGRSTFSVLLAQDLAVAPILIMVAVLGSGVGDDGLSPAAIGQAVASLLPSVIGVGLLVLLGTDRPAPDVPVRGPDPQHRDVPGDLSVRRAGDGLPGPGHRPVAGGRGPGRRPADRRD